MSQKGVTVHDFPFYKRVQPLFGWTSVELDPVQPGIGAILEHGSRPKAIAEVFSRIDHKFDLMCPVTFVSVSAVCGETRSAEVPGVPQEYSSLGRFSFSDVFWHCFRW